MDKKIQLQNFPSLNDVCLVPKHILSKLIESYDDFEYIKKQMKEVEDIKSGTRKSYSFEEFEQMMEREGL